MVMLPPKKQFERNINNMEIWKTYREKTKYNSKIEISNFGNVREDNIVINYDDNYPGYYTVAGKRLNRIVAELFISNPYNKPEVDHIDTNIHNNRVDNLRWVTHKENMNNPLSKRKMSISQTGKILSTKTKSKMSLGKKGNDYVKGRIHINNGEICKMIKPEDLQTYLDKSWICGRIYRRNTCHS